MTPPLPFPRAVPLLRLLQLTSPALPIGAYAYSQGLESAIHRGSVTDGPTVAAWIGGLLDHGVGRLDAPVLVRLHRAWRRGTAVAPWNDQLFAARETRELQEEDRHLGQALARLLAALDMAEAAPWQREPRCCLATPFALAAARWGIDAQQTVLGYLWLWSEHQVAAATKLVPLGQTAAQRLLFALATPLQDAAAKALTLEDEDLGASTPGLAHLSAHHETQYSRLFRS